MHVHTFAMPAFSWLYRLMRWCLGGIFIYSGLAKLLAPATFAVLIDAYGLLPEILLMPVAVMIPLIEVLAGVGILFDLRSSLTAITGLLFLFVAILGYGMWMGLDVDCGCFGPEDPEAKAFHGLRTALYRDIALLAGVFFLYGWRIYSGLAPTRLSAFKGKLNQTEEANV